MSTSTKPTKSVRFSEIGAEVVAYGSPAHLSMLHSRLRQGTQQHLPEPATPVELSGSTAQKGLITPLSDIPQPQHSLENTEEDID